MVNAAKPTSPVSLSSGPLEVVLDPALGGSIERFDFTDQGRSIEILRGAQGEGSVLDAACFPLVPYVNRIRGGEFSFRGRTIRLAPNMAGDPNPLHGQGWLNPWRVAAASQQEAVLEFEHPAGEWPWAYVARQHFKLDERGLTIELSCRNLSDEPMPCGLGQHPYFRCSPETRLQTKVEHVWTIDEQVLPVERVPATGRYDLTSRRVCGLDLDHGFGGWSGTAVVTDPSWPFELTMSSPDASFFQLYSPPRGGIFVIEPVTHANAALNAPEDEWAGLGIRVLEPNGQMSLRMRLELS